MFRGVLTKRRRLNSARYVRNMRQMRGRIERRMVPVLKSYFKAQSARAVARLLGQRAKIGYQTKAHPADLIPASDDGVLAYELEPFYTQAAYAAVDAASAAIGDTPDVALYSDIVQRELEQAGERITGINDATREDVAELLAEGGQRGYSLYEIANGVPDESFPGLGDLIEETYAGRAEAIARTEMAYATQGAALEDWRQSGVEMQELEDGEDFDDECAARNGTIISIDEDADPLHTNCTIVSLPVIEDYNPGSGDSTGGE